MAQRVNVVLVDDIDESEADETVSFAIDGVEYEIDLSAKNARELRDGLAKFAEAGRKVGGRRRGGGRSSARTGATASDIRTWARENGWDIPDRGRVASEVREAYAAAH